MNKVIKPESIEQSGVYMENQKLKNYLTRTVMISWISWLILALSIKNNILTLSNIMGTTLFIIGGFAPTISAISLQEKKPLNL